MGSGMEDLLLSRFGEQNTRIARLDRDHEPGNIDPEEALERTNKKFIKRFQYLERESAKDGKKLGEMTLAEMDKYWDRAKTL